MTLNAPPQVGLFVTCLVDLFRPSIGFAAIKLIKAGGGRVEVPRAQTCCGQPAYNCGDRKSAIAIARQVVETFERFDYVVAPSGSCAGMLKLHYPVLLANDPEFAERAASLAGKSFELTSFLTDVLGLESVNAAFAGTVTYHDSCSALRELGVSDAPRRLLKSVRGLSLLELGESEVCCGFGGAFSVKYPEISTARASGAGRDALCPSRNRAAMASHDPRATRRHRRPSRSSRSSRAERECGVARDIVTSLGRETSRTRGPAATMARGEMLRAEWRGPQSSGGRCAAQG